MIQLSKTKLLLLSFLLSGVLASANETYSPENPSLLQFRQLFLEYQIKDAGHIHKVVDKGDELLQELKNHPVILIYQGIAYTIEGREAWMPWNKLKLVEKGLDKIDLALKILGSDPRWSSEKINGVPILLDAQLSAIFTFTSIPDNYFHRFQQAKTMWKGLYEKAVVETLPSASKALFYTSGLMIAMHDENLDQAQDLFNKLDNQVLSDDLKVVISDLKNEFNKKRGSKK